MPFTLRRRHQYWTSDVRYMDHELGGRAYVVSVMDNHSRYILSSALTRSQDLSSYLAVLYAAVERYGWPTLGESTTMHTRLRCSPAREESTAWRATCPSPTAAGHPTSTFG
jgi:transposase InsO family protein